MPQLIHIVVPVIDMTLQELFVKNKGLPLKVGANLVIQMDRLPIKKGQVLIKFIDQDENWGIALKATKGSIVLAGGEQVKLLHIWSDSKNSAETNYRVDCHEGELRVWNIYKRKHANGEVTVDQWTGNSGMIVVNDAPTSRLYRACCGLGPFVADFRFEIRWVEEK